MSVVFKIVDQLSQGLDITALRHKILSNNLANANTPQYRRSDVDFEFYMTRNSSIPMMTTNQRHLTTRTNSGARAAIVEDHSTTMRTDGNNVDVEREMVFLMENQLHYQAMVDILNRNLGVLRTAIGEGRR